MGRSATSRLMKKRVVAIVQARMRSTRLPGKVLREISGKPLLQYLVDRINYSSRIDDLVIATSVLFFDNIIAKYCTSNNIKCYRGSEDDVLSRYVEAAIWSKADYIVRICADSPLVDPEIIDGIIDEFLVYDRECDYLSNTINQTYPLGMNVEVFSIAALKKAHLGSSFHYEREHVTPYIYSHPDKFKIRLMHLQNNLSNLRLTVDEEADFELVKWVIEQLYPSNPNFNLSDILTLLKCNPEKFEINSHVKQKNKWHKLCCLLLRRKKIFFFIFMM
jgi:spore coat polysaccharide biosynthesis protein SpsF